MSRRRSLSKVRGSAPKRITLKAWMRRWKLVNDFERDELRRTPVETKVRQLATMMALAERLDWRTSTEAELLRLRQRWVRLRTVMRADRPAP